MPAQKQRCQQQGRALPHIVAALSLVSQGLAKTKNSQVLCIILL
jgi:hypothetical protein